MKSDSYFVSILFALIGCIIFLLLLDMQLFGQDKKKTVYFTIEFSCMEINEEEYHGSPAGQRYKSDAKITYEFNEPVALKGLNDPTIYSKAKKAVITYWKNDKWHTKNVFGNIKQGIKKSSRIKKEKS